MSSKVYSAVPTDDPDNTLDPDACALSDGHLDRDDLEDQLEDDLLSPSHRLLAFSSLESGYSTSKRETVRGRAARWAVTRWAACRLRRFADNYEAFREQYSERTIMLAALYALLLVSTIGLAISTAALAGQRNEYRRHYPHGFETRLPWTMSRPSMNYKLWLPEVFPTLSSNGDWSCKAAWFRLKEINCHEKILNRAWDNGTQLSLFEPRYDLYAEAISDPACIWDLELSHQVLASQCTLKDTFDTIGYIGPMTADPYLEKDVTSAVQTLLARARHTARRPPYSFAPVSKRLPVPCAAELYQDWSIVDGMYSNNLNGIDTFLTATASLSVREDFDVEFASDYSDRAFPPQRWYFENGKRGPGESDTHCSWCLLNWFDRKLGAWEEGNVLDPANGSAMSLPTYLRSIEKAGRRCQDSDWSRIFRKNIWTYQEKGWLSKDWADDSEQQHKALELDSSDKHTVALLEQT